MNDVDTDGSLAHHGARSSGARGPWLSSPLTRVFVECVLLTAVMIGLGFLVTRVLAFHWPLSIEDQAVRALVAERTPARDRISDIVSLIAFTSGIAIAAVVAGSVMRAAYHRWRELLFLAAAVLAQLEVFSITAPVVARARPAVVQLDHFPEMQSFPSGHTAAAIAVYGGIAMILAMHARRKAHAVAWWALLLVVPIAVGISRLYRGMHHPSDVVASFIGGLSCLFILKRAMFGSVGPPALGSS